jgi:hypothetical protein
MSPWVKFMGGKIAEVGDYRGSHPVPVVWTETYENGGFREEVPYKKSRRRHPHRKPFRGRGGNRADRFDRKFRFER